MKEQITQFDINAAFKALDELDIPAASKRNSKSSILKEAFKKTDKFEALFEDYYDVQNQEELADAAEEREAEVAKAKLARIEKIVDLEAESEEDLLPSYAGKVIIQCPQCMTLFYKKEEDLVKDESDPDVVNVNEACQHCGNVSGYNIIGKVAPVEENELDNFDTETDVSVDNDFDLDFDEAGEDKEIEVNQAEDESTDEDSLDAVDVSDEEEEEGTEKEEEEEEDKKESLDSASSSTPLVENVEKEDDYCSKCGKKICECTCNKDLTESTAEDELNKYKANLLEDAVSDDESEEAEEDCVAEKKVINEGLDDFGVVVTTEAPVVDNGVTEIVPATEQPEATTITPEPTVTGVNEYANKVMAAYQNANKWLDSIKEAIYTKMNCPFFSSYVHSLAHTMPARFDKFGDILHTVNLEIPYPATAAIDKTPITLVEAFDMIFNILNNIKTALNEFITASDKDYHGMACAAEACLNDIEAEYPMLYRLHAKAVESKDDSVAFDKFVAAYVEHKDDLLEDLAADEKETGSEALKELFNKQLVGDINIGVDAHDFGGTGNNVSVLSPGITENKNCEACEDCEENLNLNDKDVATANIDKKDKDLDELFNQQAVGDINVNLDATGFGGTNNVVDVLKGGKLKECSETLTEEDEGISEAELNALLDSKEFKKPVSEEEVEKLLNDDKELADELEDDDYEDDLDLDGIDEISDDLLENCITDSLKTVYENVESFVLSNCTCDNNKLIVEGIVKFKSGKLNSTSYVFTEAKKTNCRYKLVGINEDLSKDGKFVLKGTIQSNNKYLYVESLSYKYNIDNKLVEGLSKSHQ